MNNETTTRDDDRSTREAILAMLKDGMDDLSEDLSTADPDGPAEEKLQLRRYHELGYLANQYRKLKRDTHLDEMDERLALLEDDRDG